MVIFGAGGDLTKRLIMPALYNLAVSGQLSDCFAIIGISTTELTTDSWREQVSDMARCAAEARGEFEQARQEFQKSIDLRPDYLLARMALAQLQLRRREWDGALRSAEQGADKSLRLSLAREWHCRRGACVQC